METTSRLLRLSLYIGGVALLCLGANTLVFIARHAVTSLLLLAAAWVPTGIALAMLGSRSAELRVPRAPLVGALVAAGVLLAVVGGLTLVRTLYGA